MGNRANLVIVENGRWRLHYSHWIGCRTLDALICGPAAALRFISPFDKCEPTRWTDPLWADGGVMIDLDNHRMLFFGDELMCEMFIRRAVLDVLTLTWPGFTIGWAYGGTEEMAAYVDADRLCNRSPTAPELTLTRSLSALCHLVSVVGADDKVRLWPLWWGQSAAWHGPAMIERLPGKGVRRLKLGVIPESGVHVDIPRQRVGAWVTSEAGQLFEELPRRWHDWQTIRWDDRYEEQLSRCRGALILPNLDLADGIDVAQRWLHERYKGERDIGLVWCGRPTHSEWSGFEAACAQLRSLYTKSA